MYVCVSSLISCLKEDDKQGKTHLKLVPLMLSAHTCRLEKCVLGSGSDQHCRSCYLHHIWQWENAMFFYPLKYKLWRDLFQFNFHMAQMKQNFVTALAGSGRRFYIYAICNTAPRVRKISSFIDFYILFFQFLALSRETTAQKIKID